MRKWLACFIILGCCLLSYSLYVRFLQKPTPKPTHSSHQTSYFIPLKITKSTANIPLVNICIGEKTIPVKVDLGFGGHLSLPKKTLEQIQDKAFLKRSFYFGIRGKKYDSDMYEIPKITLSNLSFFQVKAEEKNSVFAQDAILFKEDPSSPKEEMGSIGWPLFYNCNFFMDYENSLIAFCDSIATLKERGYPVNFFVETPLLLDKKLNLIEFEAMTEFGSIRCVLDTGCTQNLLNKNINGEANEHMIFNRDTLKRHGSLNSENTDQMTYNSQDDYDMTTFKINNKNFGPLTFNKIKIPFEIDVIIGMDLLESMLVFVDFHNQKIYFYEKGYCD